MFNDMDKNDVVRIVQPDVGVSVTEEMKALGLEHKMSTVATSVEHVLRVCDSTVFVLSIKDPGNIAVR